MLEKVRQAVVMIGGRLLDLVKDRRRIGIVLVDPKTLPNPHRISLKAQIDALTIFFLIFYLGVLLYGAIDSTSYSLQYGERSSTAWRPYLWPIKIIMCFGIFLMLLQAISEFFKDILRLRGEEI